MELIQPPTTSQIIAKIIWDNLIQVIMFIVVLILLIIQWVSLETEIRIGAITLLVMYFIIRFAVAYQSLKFEKDLEKEKKRNKEEFQKQ